MCSSDLEANGQASEEMPLRIEIMVARNGAYSVNGQNLINKIGRASCRERV